MVYFLAVAEMTFIILYTYVYVNQNRYERLMNEIDPLSRRFMNFSGWLGCINGASVVVFG